MDNVGPTGSLDQDKLLCALLQVRNTPYPDCEISPDKIVFGRQLHDVFTFLNRISKFTNSHVRPAWHDAWKKKDVLRMCFTRSFESLDTVSVTCQNCLPGTMLLSKTIWSANTQKSTVPTESSPTINADLHSHLREFPWLQLLLGLWRTPMIHKSLTIVAHPPHLTPSLI